MTPEVGQMFGPYEILGRLGSGGMGLVFRAWDQRLYREVAIKIVRDNYRVPGMRERFLQEARAASRLNHPNICTVFDIGEKDGDPYLVMELLEGDTLKERIARGALSAEELVLCAREVADALSVAHAKSIIHRDIKPANIFLVRTAGGGFQAKVLDFGLAKINRRISPSDTTRIHLEQSTDVRPEDSPLDITAEGVTVGTVSYMSPEQARGHALDPRSDLFSLGIVMYEMATRRPPFRGTNSSQVFTEILENDPEPLRNWNDSIPRDLERIILKLLSKDRRQRFASGQELSSALEKLTGRMSKGSWLRRTPSAPIVPIVPTHEPVAYHRRRLRKDSTPDRSHIAPPISNSTHIKPLRIPVSEPAAMQASPSSAAVLTLGSSSAEVEETFPPHVLMQSADPVLTGSGMSQFEYEIEESSKDTIAQRSAPSSRTNMFALKTWSLRIGATAAILAVVAAAVIIVRGGRLSAPTMGRKDILLLTTLQDRTDEKLGGAVLEGLNLSLTQTRAFTVRGDATYFSGARQLIDTSSDIKTPSPRAVAQKVGAKAYLFGEIHHLHNGGLHSPYVIRVDALKANTNDRLLSLTEQADALAEIPAAIDRLARALRNGLGEDRDIVADTSEPLSRQATGDIDALKAYSEGEIATHSGRYLEAIASFRSASEHDGQFAQAHLQLAWLYSAQHAEVAASEAARLAQISAKSGNLRIRLLSEFAYELITIGDYGRASTTIRQFNDRFPNDTDGTLDLARVLRAQGHLVESLLAAQQTFDNDPYRSSAYNEAELDMIGLGRFTEALKLEQQAETLGVPPSRAGIPASYLANRSEILEQQMNALEDSSSAHRSPTPSELAAHALALDNSGRWEEGEQVWTRSAAMAATIPGLQSASVFMLNQAALNRAVAGRCSDALDLLRMNNATQRGPIATFRGGMAAALCGRNDDADQAIAALDHQRSNGLPITHYGTFELRAALALHRKDPSGALAMLEEVEAPNDYALVPYLRSLAYTASGQPQEAAEDLRVIVEHHGAVYLSGISVYPQAKLELDRATIRTQLAMGH
jgi:serine/threonine-protein kinase